MSNGSRQITPASPRVPQAFAQKLPPFYRDWRTTLPSSASASVAAAGRSPELPILRPFDRQRESKGQQPQRPLVSDVGRMVRHGAIGFHGASMLTTLPPPPSRCLSAKWAASCAHRNSPRTLDGILVRELKIVSKKVEVEGRTSRRAISAFLHGERCNPPVAGNHFYH